MHKLKCNRPVLVRLSITFIAIFLCWQSAFAGDSDTWRGQSDQYFVEFPDPLAAPNAMIEIAEFDVNDIGYYTKKLPPVSFKTECRATRNKISCSANGKSPLAGAVYRRTRDATPNCPGHVEDRFTCVAGCKPSVPRYISINPWEC